MTDQNTNTTSSHQGFCAACGAELPADSTFCPTCGVRIAQEIPANVIANAAAGASDETEAPSQQAAPEQTAPTPTPEPQNQTPADDEPAEVVVESASAISDPARNKSGNLAWIITGIVVLCVIAVSFGVSSCTSTLVSAGIAASQNGRTTSRGIPDLDEQLDQIVQNNNVTSPTTETKRDTDKSSGNSASDIVSYDFYLYDGGITEGINASDYSGSTAEVSGFVKGICSIDKTYNDKVILALRSIARDESTTDEQVKEIRDCVTNAKKEIGDSKVPTVTGDDADECMQYMEEAKTDANARWDSISTLADYLTDPSKVKRSQLSSLDSQMNSHTSDASLALYSALLWSSLL